jgi:anthranilate synthase component 1
MYSPTLDEFRALASQGNLIPVTRRLLADIETPLSAYRKIRGSGESFLFESVEGGEHLGRYSFVGCNPRAAVRQDRERVRVIERGKTTAEFRVTRQGSGAGEVGDGLAVVEGLMKKYRPVAVGGLPRFTGGAIGYIGYEFIHDIEPVVKRPPHDDLETPVMYFLIADQLLIFDRAAQTLAVLVNAVLDDSRTVEAAYQSAVSEIERIVSLLEQPSEHHPVTVPREVPAIPFESNVPR